MDFFVRSARHGDLEQLVQLLETLFSLEKDFSFDGAKQKKGLLMLLESCSASVLVAEMNAQVVGMCTGQLLVSTAEGGPVVLVEDVVVRREVQRQGVGRRLIEALEDWAMENRATRLQLLADCNNSTALLFYRKLGWVGTDLICLRKIV